MRERYFVGSFAGEIPRIEGVYWFDKKQNAIAEAQRQREFYFNDIVILAKVLNIPKKTVVSNKTEAKE